MTENLLSVLDKRRKPEDFLSEVFVFVLNRLKKRHPALAAEIICRLSGNTVQVQPADASRVEVTTRHTLPNGSRPDITINGAKFLLHVEVKRSDPVNDKHLRKQLKNYLADLEQRTEIPQRWAVLLAHRSFDDILEDIPDHRLFAKPIYWYEIAEGIADGSDGVVAGATKFLVRQFIEFLKEEGLAVDRVRPSVLNGAKSLMHLNNQVVKTLRDQGVRPKTYGWVDGTGHKFSWSDIPCEVAYHYDYSQALVFYAKVGARKRLSGRLNDQGWEDVEDEPSWKSKELNLEEVDFFAAKSSAIQGKVLNDFIGSCMNDLRGTVRT